MIQTASETDQIVHWENFFGQHLIPKSFSGEFNYLSITTQITVWLSRSFNIGISWGPRVYWIPNDAVVEQAARYWYRAWADLSTFTRPPREGSTFVYDRDEASTEVIARPWSYQNKPPSFWALQSIDTCILHNAIYIDLDSLHVNSTVVNQSVVILCPSFAFCFTPLYL